MMHSRNRSNSKQNGSSKNSKSPILHVHFIQQFPLFSTIFLAAIIALIFGSNENKVEGRIRRESSHLPLSMDKEMFPPQNFDAEAPICLAEREPCGFYSFSLDGKAPLKWIKSWCRCSSKHECVYERTDMRMRVYRQVCVVPRNDELTTIMEENENKPIEMNSQENQTMAPIQGSTHHRHHHHHHRHNHHFQQKRHTRRANRRLIIRRLRAITLDD